MRRKKDVLIQETALRAGSERRRKLVQARPQKPMMLTAATATRATAAMT